MLFLRERLGKVICDFMCFYVPCVRLNDNDYHDDGGDDNPKSRVLQPRLQPGLVKHRFLTKRFRFFGLS